MISVERFEDCYKELSPLWEAHWNETESHRIEEEYNPNIEEYINLNRLGLFFQFVVRDDGVAIGHAGIHCYRSLQSQALIAAEDSYYILPEYRGMGLGRKLISYVEKFMAWKGAKMLIMVAKNGNHGHKLLDKMGYNDIGRQYFKRLEPTARAIH